MIKEYAVDPKLLNSWERVRYYCEYFGWERGRLISRFPKAWKKLVWENAQSAQPRERKRIEEFMARMDARLLEQCRAYDGARPWHQNAAAGHLERPFSGIVTDDPVTCGAIGISNDEFSEEHPLLQMQRLVEVPRTPSNLASVLHPILANAKRLLLVDAYFDPQPASYLEAPTFRSTKWTLPLAAILLRVPSLCAVEYHALRPTSRGTRIPFGAEEARDSESWKRCCHEALPHVLPAGSRLTIHRWQELPQGEDFHARYVITDRCALMIDPGLDASHAKATDTTKLTLLGESDRLRLMARFDKASTAFTHLSEHLIVGNGDCLSEGQLRDLGRHHV